MLADGRSPAPRAVGDLLVALRQAGARSVSPPCCARCGKQLRTFQRRGQDWYCAACGQRAEPCAACGKARPVSSRDRAGQPRCAKCPEADGRDPVTVIHGIITGLDPHASRDAVAAAVRRSAPRPSYQQKLAWALEDNPAVADRGGPSGAVAGDPAVHRSAARRRRRRDRPSCLPRLSPGGAHRQAAGWRAGLPDLHRALARSSSAHAAEPAASPSPATTRAGRCAPTASSPTRRTWRPASAAGAAAGSNGGPRTGRCAPAAPRCRC